MQAGQGTPQQKRCEQTVALSLSTDSLAGSSLALPRPTEHGAEPEQPAPPDGGWGWVIVTASFFIHSFLGLSFTMFSVLYINLVETLDGATGDIGWVGSIYGFSSQLMGKCLINHLNNDFHQRTFFVCYVWQAVQSMFVELWVCLFVLQAVPASIVTDIYGHRIVAVIGSLIAFLGFFLSSFAPNVTVLYITYGLIGGKCIRNHLQRQYSSYL